MLLVSIWCFCFVMISRENVRAFLGGRKIRKLDLKIDLLMPRGKIVLTLQRGGSW